MKVLFVCNANFGRSPMAECFFNKLSKNSTATSAGINTGDKKGQAPSEDKIRCMSEIGYDLSKHRTKQLTPEMVKNVDRIIVLCDNELPQYVDKSKVTFWDVENTWKKPYEVRCKVRNQILELVKKLVEELE